MLHSITAVLLGSVAHSRYFYITRRRIPVLGVEVSRDSLRVRGQNVINALRKLWTDESGQDVAEYAVMLAVILVIVIGTVRLIGGNANNVFSQVSSSISQ